MNPPPPHPLGVGTSSTPPRGTILGLLRGRGLSQSHDRPPAPTASNVPVLRVNTDAAPVAVEPSAVTAHGPSYRIRLVPHIDSRRSLKFDPITRDLKEGEPALRIGRANAHSQPSNMPQPHPTTGKVAFKSKVVSRSHAELWVEASGQFYVRDTRSSSGTFLNRARLSSANEESPARNVKDGDVLQLGVDYQGGTEDIYKSVKMRVEIGREWQDGRNVFNTSAMKNLKSIANAGNKTGLPDCCICLYAVRVHQALFIAPCSHTFHYKCIRPLVDNHHPAFSCPLCRSFADLNEDVEIDVEESEAAEEDVASEGDANPADHPDDHEEDDDEAMAGVVAEDVMMPHAMGMNDLVQQVKYPS